MAQFVVQKADGQGHVNRTTMQAASRRDVCALLLSHGEFPISVTESAGPGWRRQMSAMDAALGLRVLASLLRSGLPLMKALHAMEQVAPPAWSAALPSIRDRVREGETLAGALDGAGIQLPEAAMGAIRAGEAGSDAAGAVERAARMLEARAAARNAMMSALAYPAVLTCATVVSLGLLIGAVLPRFERMLTEMGQPLPATLNMLITVRRAAAGSALPIIIISIAAGLVWYQWTHRAEGRRTWHEWLLASPLLGRIRFSSASARVAETMAALIQSGVPVIAALKNAAGATGDSAIERRLLKARSLILEGYSLSVAFQMTRGVTPTVIFFAAAAEQNGDLAHMLQEGGRIEAERADRMTRSAARLVEPVLILALAGVIAVVAAALLRALYGIQPAI